MIEPQEGRRIILDSIEVLGGERVGLENALGRVCMEEVPSPIDIPPWDNTAMDGFAVRAADTRGASPDSPVTLEVLEDLPAGYVAGQAVGPGQAIRIMTGAPMPEGSDAVLRREDARFGNGSVEVLIEVPPGKDMRLCGEDVRQGSVVVEAGRVLTPADLGMLASVGRGAVTVRQRPRVAVLSTGDELVEAEQPLGPGQIRNSNSYTLYGQIQAMGAVPIKLGIARDTREDLEEKLKWGLSCHALITTGGVSVGDFDYVKEVLQHLGSEMAFWRVAMRPGRPFAFGRIGGIPTFGLPGNPVSSMVSFEVFVRPALRKMMGHARLYRPMIKAVLDNPLETKGGYTYFLRVAVRVEDGRYRADSTGPQGSGILRSMTVANGLAVVPKEKPVYQAGEEVEVMLLDETLERV